VSHRVLVHFANGDVRSCPVRAVQSKHGLTSFTDAQCIAPDTEVTKLELVMDMGDGVKWPPVKLGISESQRKGFKVGQCIDIGPIRIHHGG